MSEQLVTVFGGTGFLGRRVVRHLAASGCSVRVAARRPDRVDFSDVKQHLQLIKADIQNPEQVAAAVAGASAVVNAVALFVEKGPVTFDAIHVEGAARVARCARDAKVKQLVHVSGIGVDENSSSGFVSARARGEKAVEREFNQTVLVRPSVMCGCDDSLLSSLEQVTRFPVVPLFGNGASRMQPAWVEDVGLAIARLCLQETGAPVYELGGAKVYSYREAVETVAEILQRKRVLMPFSFALWRVLVGTMQALPNPPLTQDQLTLMQSDNIVSSDSPGFDTLGIEPQSLESVAASCFAKP